MVTATSDSLEIRVKDPQPLFVEALNTVTLGALPISADVGFLAHGINVPIYLFMEVDEHYLRECEEKGVKPYTLARFAYDEERKMLLPTTVAEEWVEPKDREPLTIPHLATPEQKAEIMRLFVKGGKPHRVDCNLEYCLGEFRSGLMQHLLNEGYIVNNASFDLGHYAAKRHMDRDKLVGTEGGQLFLSLNRADGILALHGRGLDEESVQKEEPVARTLAWFNQLKAKYS